MLADQIVLLMRRQWGLVSRQQALSVGLASNTIYRRLARGEWQSAGPGVYRDAASTHAESWHERLMAACLQGAPHAVASHRSAACLWRLDDFFFRKPTPPEVTVPRGRVLAGSAVRVYASRSPVLKAATKTGIPCTPLPRTLIDLCSVVTHRELEIALDSALRFRPAWRSWVRKEVAALAQRHPARDPLLALIDERDYTFDSKPEVDVSHLLWSAGLWNGCHVHYPISDGGLFIGEVDYCWPELRLFVQFHGLGVHLRADRLRIDAWQTSQLSARGWTPIVTTKQEVEQNPVGFVSNLQRAYLRCCEREGIVPNLVLGP